MQTAVNEVPKFDTVALLEKFIKNGKGIRLFVTVSQIVRNELDHDCIDPEELESALDYVWGDIESGLVRGLKKKYKHCGTPVNASVSKILNTDQRQLTICCQCCNFKLSIDEDGKINGQ